MVMTGAAGYPLISEAALRNRNTSFAIDGEAVLLGVDGRSDFNGLHSRRHDHEVEFYAFDILVSDGEDLRRLPLSMRKASLAPGYWRAASMASSSAILNRARLGRICSGVPA
jgi:bifunctional non-homologous end joining protein LigD